MWVEFCCWLFNLISIILYYQIIIIGLFCGIQTDWKAVDEFIEVDRNVQEVNWAEPGTKAGLEMLESFCKDRLKFFATDRNNPTKKGLSDLSPWFHAGNDQLIMIVKSSTGFLQLFTDFLAENECNLKVTIIQDPEKVTIQDPEF